MNMINPLSLKPQRFTFLHEYDYMCLEKKFFIEFINNNIFYGKFYFYWVHCFVGFRNLSSSVLL